MNGVDDSTIRFLASTFFHFPRALEIGDSGVTANVSGKRGAWMVGLGLYPITTY